MDPSASATLAQCTKILQFWHQVEFFIPFDLQRQVLESKDAAASVRTLSKERLSCAASTDLWSILPPTEQRLVGFDVYFGLFDKSVLGNIADNLFGHGDAIEENEQIERGDLDGYTCFAKMRIDERGIPLLDEISVSTAPWAIGRVRKSGLRGLSFESFEDGVRFLKDYFREFRARVPTGGPESSDEFRPATGQDILDLLYAFYSWAGFDPGHSDEAPSVAIRARFAPQKGPRQAPEDDPKDTITHDDDGSNLEDSSVETEIDILNSFFAKDIARAISSMSAGAPSRALISYLCPLDESDRLDVYDHTGETEIVRTLHPSRLNTGHWFDDPGRTMSLMQQFAISKAFQHTSTTSLFSVNGPPGTGKTTLLRDIFADLITRRARALARHPKATDVFGGPAKCVRFAGDPDSCDVRPLRTDITGFEIVVASSNNAAVENISIELPRTESLGEKNWRDSNGSALVGYLRPVAHKLAAKTPKGEYRECEGGSTPWGLISGAIGNRRNRKRFAEGLFSPPKPGEHPKGYSRPKHKTLWHWRDDCKVMAYSEARQNFLACCSAVDSRVDALSQLADLVGEIRSLDADSFTATTKRLADDAATAHSEARLSLGRTETLFRRTEARLKSERESEILISKRRPPWWLILFRLAEHKRYRKMLNECIDLQLSLQGKLSELQLEYETQEEVVARAKQTYEDAASALAAKRAEWKHKHERLRILKEQFADVAIMESLEDISSNKWQTRGLWHDETLNQIRSDLFAAALALHEAWLAEVTKRGMGFGPNLVAVNKLLSGGRLVDKEDALTIWQSLFMVVPVLSTTFASFAGQFRELGAETIGWVFVDEAGQAVPQAAVGALWRAKRAVVVGDPLQIEPVFTVPVRLLRSLAETSGIPEDLRVSPDKASVQTLADAANPFGASTDVKGRPLWVGSPLRVHRRCADPMFTLANGIAYEGKMIFGPEDRNPPANSIDIGRSAWIHVTGAASHKQVVPAQIEVTHRALASLYAREGALPPLYIISPFKRVAAALRDCISNEKAWAEIEPGLPIPEKKLLREWCERRIGTVHTFQGKEESIVWMVLGCDWDTQGAATWAASKPNILNVALTRARHRFFIIGDADLWGSKNYFSQVKAELPQRLPHEFITHILKGEGPANSGTSM